jgi:enamine deaminase RidA (YjgF/YER057c/UK114 family)
MARIEKRLEELGIVLPKPMNTGSLPFDLVRIDGERAVLSGHVPLDANGAMAKPLGKVGAELTADQGYQAARLVGLGFLASLKQALDDLDRVTGWIKLFGMVNAAPGFNALPGVINGCSELIIDVFGPEVGAHARSAVGLAELPFGVPVEIEGEVKIRT